jgi:LmbE family N-acetylglucosaminyl deacetylase
MSVPASAAGHDPVDAVYLSPHLDDAAFSCGGQIHARARRGERVLVVTVFAGPAPPTDRLSPFAASLHRLWGLDRSDVVEARRAEDRGAVAVLGADCLHLELSDAIYRTDEHGQPLYPAFAALFDDTRREDDTLEASLRDALGTLPASPFVAAPLGVGAHVDHGIVHRAARAVLPRDRLWLYEDYPYAESWRARRRSTARCGGWDKRAEPLVEADLAAKCRAISCYASQLGTAFRGDQLERRVRRFHRRRGGERLWQPGVEGPADAAEDLLTPARSAAARGSAAARRRDR